MSKLLLIFFFLIPFYGTAQSIYASYKCSLSPKPLNILVAIHDERFYSLYIDMYSEDNLLKNGGIVIHSEDHNKFIENLNYAKLKYSEWAKVAKQNNVKYLNREMTIDFEVLAVMFYQGDQVFRQNSGKLKFLFSIYEDKKVLSIQTGPIQASSDKTKNHKGFKFYFESEKEISDFINLISVAKIQDYIKKPNTKDLFKD